MKRKKWGILMKKSLTILVAMFTVVLFFGVVFVPAFAEPAKSEAALSLTNREIRTKLKRTLKRIMKDPRYDVINTTVLDSGFVLDETRTVIKTVGRDIAVLIPVIDGDGTDKGLISVHADTWTLSLDLPTGLKSYTVSLNNTDGAVAQEVSVNLIGVRPTRSLTGSDWCMYTSHFGMNFGCWSPDDNPFGYYHVTTYREGDMISAFHYAWWADWTGTAVVCPVNEKSWSPFTWVQCGFPPN